MDAGNGPSRVRMQPEGCCGTGIGTTTSPHGRPQDKGAYPYDFTNLVLGALGQKKGKSAQKKPPQHLISISNNFTGHLLE